MKKTIRLCIIHRFRILSEVLSQTLNQYDDISVIQADSERVDVLDILNKHHLDVVVFDPFHSSREGLDVIRTICQLNNSIRSVIFITEPHWQYAFRLLRAGAMGFLTESTNSEQLVEAIRSVHRGKVYLPPKMQTLFAERFVHLEAPCPDDALSDREFQVMRMLALGNTNGEISKSLFIGTKTVDSHRANLLRKLSLRNNADIARFAMQKGYIISTGFESCRQIPLI